MSNPTGRLARHATFRQLQLLRAIAETGSVSRAAEQLHLSQPTVSMQVRKLADTLGVPLFEPAGRGLRLTAAGEIVAAAARDILGALDGLDARLADLRGLRRGRLRLAVVTTAQYFAPRVLGVFSESHPGIDVELTVNNREVMLERIAAHRDDLYILGQPPEGLDMVAEPILENPLVVVAAGDHPLARERNVPPGRLFAEPFIVREPGSGTRKALERVVAEQGLELRMRMELGSTEAIKQAVAGGLGLALVSRHALGVDGAQGALVELDVQGFPLRRHWYAVHRGGPALSAVARAFLDQLREEGSRSRARSAGGST